MGSFLVAGAGVGLINTVIADVVLSVVPNERSDMAAGVHDPFLQVGVAVGIAVWGAIFLGRGQSAWRRSHRATPQRRATEHAGYRGLPPRATWTPPWPMRPARASSRASTTS